MKPYKNLAGNVGVCSYENGEDNIRIKFHTRKTYIYDHEHTGEKHVNEMKQLAAKGFGLNNYINDVVKEQYAFSLD